MKSKRIEPDPGQESVWDYPRLPRVEKVNRHIRVESNGWITSGIVGPFKGGAGTMGW